MLPAFIIHSSSSTDRNSIVQDIVQKTNATVFDAIMTVDGKDGCRKSHIEVAKLAKLSFPSSHYLVFEDDCILRENWREVLKGYEFADVLYLGYNDRCSKAVFGTHALFLSPKARDAIIQDAETLKDSVENKGAYDWILSLLCRKYGLITCMPRMENRELFCHQQKELVSLITGQLRK